jgi:xanthosine utilization system XapX-like protein
MLIGEQVVPTVKRFVAGEPVTTAWLRKECVPKISGVEPKPVQLAESRPGTGAQAE